jgi:phosphatidate cytidylyltransferase
VSGNLARRIAFAVVAIPAVFGFAWLGGWWFAGLLAVAGALGAREIYGFARSQGIDPLERLGMLGAAAAPLATAWPLLAPSWASIVVREGHVAMVWLLVVVVAAMVRRGPQGRPLAVVGVTVFGAAYAGWLLSFALKLRHPAPGIMVNDTIVGMSLLFYPLVLTWLGDTAAMAAGKAIGGPKLAPVVSPNKTWAGALAGLVTSLAASLLYAAVVFTRAGISLAVWEALVLGAAISVVGQVGDVAESVFKREIGVKDSSSIIPGHGGVLDRLDALYFAIPVTALLLHIFRIA